ncbi:MAG TPA: hypothetical protein PK635_02740 [Actinomycetota bacterium]|nr:hypothetical protein [Actinomycetota bacterium]
MAGLRYQNIGPFFSGRRMKLAGVSYEPGDPIDTDIVVGLKHLDALLSNGYIKPTRGPFTASGRQVHHVPVGIRKNLAGTELESDDVPDGTIAEIQAWVGDSNVRAQLALDVENAKETPRATLVSWLEALLA